MRAPLILLVIAVTVASAAAEVAVVNPDVAEKALSAERLRDILLGRVSTWTDGKPIVLVLSDDPQSDGAVRAASGRDDVRHLLRGWKRLVYSGAGAMPTVVDSVAAALERVRRTPGSLALVAEPPQAEGVRVIAPTR
ncbi:MAG TPA: hypothetical protein VEL07_02280 [Planctomycetota bacterium]|nr:hypothetical protein [Planctomycetota bacterium]